MRNRLIGRYCGIVLLFLLIYSCKPNQSYPGSTSFDLQDFGEPVLLKGTAMDFDEILMKPVKITLIDSFLLMKNINTEQCIHLFNTYSRKKIGERIAFGTGPDEMIDPRVVGMDENRIWILDKNRRVLNEYDADCFFNQDSLKLEGKITFSDFCNSIIPLADKGFVSLTFNDEYKRLLFTDRQGKNLGLKGDYPVAENLISYMEKIEGFIGDVVANSVGDRIIVTCKRTDLIEVYNGEGNLLKRLHGPDHFLPAIHQEGEHVRSDAGLDREAYFCPLAVGDHMFVLYSGKEAKKGDYLMNNLFVFDWNGVPVKYYRLDVPLFDFAVDAENKTIYGLTDYPESHIVAFNYGDY